MRKLVGSVKMRKNTCIEETSFYVLDTDEAIKVVNLINEMKNDLKAGIEKYDYVAFKLLSAYKDYATGVYNTVEGHVLSITIKLKPRLNGDYTMVESLRKEVDADADNDCF